MDTVCRLLEEARQDGRFALSMHHILVCAPVEQVYNAMVAAQQLGSYPISNSGAVSLPKP
jgi:hypothetical protein